MDDIDKTTDDRARFDRIDVADLIVRERLARDNRDWEEMKSYWLDDSLVDVSWFRGSGAKFVELTKANVRENSYNFHVMSPPVVNVVGNHAISETPCTLRDFSNIAGADASYEGFVRLFWRARRSNGRWLLAGLRALYLIDLFHGRDPARPPAFDPETLKGYRSPYRFLMCNLTNLGVPVRDDLPGIDQPDVVASMRAAETAWLNGGSDPRES